VTSALRLLDVDYFFVICDFYLSHFDSLLKISLNFLYCM